MSLVTPLDLGRLTPTRRVRLTGEVVSTYARVRWEMRNGDAARAVDSLRERVPAQSLAFESPAIELIAAWRLSRAVMVVLRRLPSDSRCLFSSLTLLAMLERRGIAPKLVIAVRPRPFAAHAWVEVAGEALLPVADPGYERLLEL